MKVTPVKPIRCAIYTRVSTDQGLDQEFNSLDAQYDASSAYIRSQARPLPLRQLLLRPPLRRRLQASGVWASPTTSCTLKISTTPALGSRVATPTHRAA